MRVLGVLTSVPRAEFYLFSGIRQRGHEVHVVCDPAYGMVSPLEQAGITVTPCRIDRSVNPGAIRLLRKLLDEHNFDVVHAVQRFGLSNARLALAGRPEKLVAYRGVVGNISFFLWAWLPFPGRRLDRLICVSDAVRHFFLSCGLPGFRIPAERLVTIHKGHDLNWYEPRRSLEELDVYVPEGAVLVGCIASMRPRKGISYLIRAVDRLPETPPVHLFLVGHVSDRRIRSSLARCRHPERVHILGYRDDAAAITGNLDIFVLPSVRSEGLPRSVLEAMAQAVPVVVTKVGGTPEIVADGENGLIIEPGDSDQLFHALSRLLSDETERTRIGAAGQQTVRERFDIETTVDRTIAVYSDLCMTEPGTHSDGPAG